MSEDNKNETPNVSNEAPTTPPTHREQLQARQNAAAEWLADVVAQVADEIEECRKQTGGDLDPLSMAGHLQQSIAISVPMDQAIAVMSEAVWLLAKGVVEKRASVSSLFLPGHN